MFNSRMATAVRTALVSACIGMASTSPACSSAPPSMRAATTSPATATGSTSGNPRASTTASGVYGDPEAAAKYWVQQSFEDTCGLASVADVVGKVTGNAPTEKQIHKLAQNTPPGIRAGPTHL